VADEELVPADEQLRFEAIYFGVLAVLGVAVQVVRFGSRAQELGVGIAVAAGACVLALALSVANRAPRPRRDRAQRLLPLLMVLALLTIAGDRTTTAIAAGALGGLAAAPLIGFLAIRRARAA
jgi:bacteriorhodopsin